MNTVNITWAERKVVVTEDIVQTVFERALSDDLDLREDLTNTLNLCLVQQYEGTITHTIESLKDIRKTLEGMKLNGASSFGIEDAISTLITNLGG